LHVDIQFFQPFLLKRHIIFIIATAEGRVLNQRSWNVQGVGKLFLEGQVITTLGSTGSMISVPVTKKVLLV
jgi:hypothetical protein